VTAAPPVAATRPERPYPGLRPFEQDEWAIFFGRERMIDEVIGRLAESRLVLIHGVSGSGKSSLVRAGVLPKLALQYSRHDAPWLTCAMRPSGGPLWNLATEFARLEGRGEDLERISAIAGQFNARTATLASVAGSLEGVRGKSLCLLVDQFEELFRYEKDVSRDEAELFVHLIERAASEDGEALQDGTDLHVIVTMRSEFLGECARFAGFAETINRTQYLVPRMDDDGLMRAVRRPAQMYGGEFDEGLAERLIGSVRGREDELPLLQHGLMLMWEDAERGTKPGERKRLERTIVDEAGGLADLLSRHADKVMASVVPEEPGEGLVEEVFRALTDVNSEGSAIRRPLLFHELCAVTDATPDVLRPILDAFRAPNVSFLTPYAPAPIDDKTPVDVSHEALIRCWRRINAKEGGWLQQEIRDGLAWRLLLFEAENFARDNSVTLSQAMVEAGERRLNWLNEAWSKRYGGGWAKVKALVDASRMHWRLEAEREETSRQREIENGRLRAEAAEHKAREEQMLRDKERLRAEAAEQAGTIARQRAEGAERVAREEQMRRQAEIEAERFRREAAEQSELAAKKSALLDKERARRSRLVAIMASIAAAIALALAAYWGQDRLKEEIYLLANVRTLTADQERALEGREVFKECTDCPEMIVAPAGRFGMGSPIGQGNDFERPLHEVTIAKPFAVAKFEITFDEWDGCAKYGDCNPHVRDRGWGRGRRPAINVSWDDAQTYAKWLSRITGKTYRLLSEAEYEYAARAGKETDYPWGDYIRADGRVVANCNGCGSPWDNKETAPVGSFPANTFGLYDVVGNVFEWTEDCWNDSYQGALADGSASTGGNCWVRVVRGGSWGDSSPLLRSAYRDKRYIGGGFDYVGFRVARTLTP
jgi:formylglycine-generating enzyme required for sulfatase activity